MASLRLNDCQKIARLELAASKLGSTPESNDDKPPELNLYFSGTLTESERVPRHDDDSGGELKLLRESSHPDHPVETCVLGVSLDEYLSSPEQTCNAIEGTLRRDFSTILVDEAGRQLLKEITGYVRHSVRIINPRHTDLSLYFLVDVEIRRVFCYDRLESCAICLEEYLGDCDEVVAMPCSHVFHQSCITKWLQINHCCPMCRFQIPTV